LDYIFQIVFFRRKKLYPDRIWMRYILLKRRIRVPGLYKWRGREEEMGERGKVNGGRGEGLDWSLVHG
jgi:hypothetical protein